MLIRFFLSFLILRTPPYILSMFILSSIGFPSLGCHPRFEFLSKAYLFVALVFHLLDAVLGSIYVEFSFIWFPIIGMPMFYLGLVDCFFRFSLFWRHHSLYLCSFLVPLVSKHWDSIIRMPSYFPSKAYFFVPFLSHHWDSVLCSIYVHS